MLTDQAGRPGASEAAERGDHVAVADLGCRDVAADVALLVDGTVDNVVLAGEWLQNDRLLVTVTDAHGDGSEAREFELIVRERSRA